MIKTFKNLNGTVKVGIEAFTSAPKSKETRNEIFLTRVNTLKIDN